MRAFENEKHMSPNEKIKGKAKRKSNGNLSEYGT